MEAALKTRENCFVFALALVSWVKSAAGVGGQGAWHKWKNVNECQRHWSGFSARHRGRQRAGGGGAEKTRTQSRHEEDFHFGFLNECRIIRQVLMRSNVGGEGNGGGLESERERAKASKRSGPNLKRGFHAWTFYNCRRFFNFWSQRAKKASHTYNAKAEGKGEWQEKGVGWGGGEEKTQAQGQAQGQWAVLTLLTVGHTQRVPQNGIQMFNANFNVNVNECLCVCLSVDYLCEYSMWVWVLTVSAECWIWMRTRDEASGPCPL